MTMLLGPGLLEPPGGFTIYNDPDDWTIIDQWDTRNSFGNNEMASIKSAFNNVPRGIASICWNPAGTHLTIGGTSDDTVRSFICSTPWDPDTASLTATRNVTNSRNMNMNASGSQLFLIRATDTLVNIPCSNFIVGAGAETSDMTKQEAGFPGSQDGGFYCTRNLESIIWDGSLQFGADNTRRIIFAPAGNLDAFSLGPMSDPGYNPSIGLGGSKISNDGLNYYRGVGAEGVEWVKMSTAYDPATISFTTHDINPPVDWFIQYVVMNPDDTREVWIVGDNSGFQLARMATNIAA